MNDSQLQGLFENLQATDVPEPLRRDLANAAWVKAQCFFTADYAISFMEYQSAEEAIRMAVDYATGPAVMTGAMFELAESFLETEIAFWRDTNEAELPDEPWSYYQPEISPARQRRNTTQ